MPVSPSRPIQSDPFFLKGFKNRNGLSIIECLSGEKEEYFEKILTFQSHSGAFLSQNFDPNVRPIFWTSPSVSKGSKDTKRYDFKKISEITLKFNQLTAQRIIRSLLQRFMIIKTSYLQRNWKTSWKVQGKKLKVSFTTQFL